MATVYTASSFIKCVQYVLLDATLTKHNCRQCCRCEVAIRQQHFHQLLQLFKILFVVLKQWEVIPGPLLNGSCPNSASSIIYDIIKTCSHAHTHKSIKQVSHLIRYTCLSSGLSRSISCFVNFLSTGQGLLVEQLAEVGML